MEDNQLKACPFCGGDYNYVADAGFGYWAVRCGIKHCTAQGFRSKKRLLAIKAWNTRPQANTEADEMPYIKWKASRKLGDEYYWFINERGVPVKTKDTESVVDQNRYYAGNYFEYEHIAMASYQKSIQAHLIPTDTLLKIATDALQLLSLITDQYQSTAIAREALSQIQQGEP